MFPHHHLPSKIIVTTILIIFSCIPTSHSHNCTHSFNCGERVQQIGYPFYGQDRPVYCGLEGFELKCQDNESITTIEISSQTFQVLNIDQNNHSLTLARSDLLADVCPQSFNDTAMNYALFSYVPGTVQFLNLYYYCPFGGNQIPDRNIITCAVDGGGDTNGYYLNGSWSYDQLRSCQVNVTIPVPSMAADELIRESGDNISLKGLLEEGFPVEYKFDVEACAACEGSGGLCWSGTNTSKPTCVCGGEEDEQFPERACPPSYSGGHKNHRWKYVAIAGASVCFGIVLIIFYYCKLSSFSKCLAFFGLRPKDGKDAEAFITQYRFSTPRRYKYSEIKRMTNAFKDKLGQGGFGSVFKGSLADGSLVAIKVLKESKGNGEEFFNEVASIGRTSHVNIVALKGFCYEGPKRALIYEFMPNGSLEKFIFQNLHKDNEQYLRVEKLYEIALGIARGLEYLHRGCSTRILHFDIKPHNILLDEEFCPKICDFGLAKLHSGKESIVSMVQGRGTIGYTAPEVFNRNFGGVSHKSDVYSYGMMVLEMVGGRKNLDIAVVHSSEIYFPQWIYKRIEIDEDLQLQQGTMTVMENETAKKMIIVGLWCIQPDPSLRPSMNKVIEMLVADIGSAEALTVPPNPFFSSTPQLPASSSATLRE